MFRVESDARDVSVASGIRSTLMEKRRRPVRRLLLKTIDVRAQGLVRVHELVSDTRVGCVEECW
jgi:hypothetical protein